MINETCRCRRDKACTICLNTTSSSSYYTYINLNSRHRAKQTYKPNLFLLTQVLLTKISIRRTWSDRCWCCCCFSCCFCFVFVILPIIVTSLVFLISFSRETYFYFYFIYTFYYAHATSIQVWDYKFL